MWSVAPGSGFEHLALVVYYSQALLYNSPVEAPGWGIEQVAAKARELTGAKSGPFDSIWLFLAIDAGRTIRVY
jgi:hypothetical protein